MQQNCLEDLLNLLGPFNNPVIPITIHPLKRLGQSYVLDLYSFLIDVKSKKKRSISRPKCPVITFAHAPAARRPYKEGMAKYIAQWGYQFENPVSVAPSLLEATANYLEKK
jgi:hypothetical protein